MCNRLYHQQGGGDSLMDLKVTMYEVMLRLKSLPEQVEAIWGALGSIVFFLIGVPDAPLFALIIVMGFDLITKIRALSANNGGYLAATNAGIIRSRTAFRGTFDKVVAYAMLIVIVHMSKYFIPEIATQLLKTMSYGFLYYVEGHSCLENMYQGAKEGSAVSTVTKFLLGQWSEIFSKYLPKKEK